jgi:hypothetical protein
MDKKIRGLRKPQPSIFLWPEDERDGKRESDDVEMYRQKEVNRHSGFEVNGAREKE